MLRYIVPVSALSVVSLLSSCAGNSGLVTSNSGGSSGAGGVETGGTSDAAGTGGASLGGGNTATGGTGTGGSGTGGEATGSAGTAGSAGMTATGGTTGTGGTAGAAGGSSAGATTADGCPIDDLIGFATVSGQGVSTTTGGGNATPTTVTTCADFKAAIADKAPRVIMVSGTITGESCNGGDGFAVASNKTIIGVNKNAKIHGGVYMTECQ